MVLACVAGEFIGVTRARVSEEVARTSGSRPQGPRPLTASPLVFEASPLTRARVNPIKPPDMQASGPYNSRHATDYIETKNKN